MICTEPFTFVSESAPHAGSGSVLSNVFVVGAAPAGATYRIAVIASARSISPRFWNRSKAFRFICCLLAPNRRSQISLLVRRRRLSLQLQQLHPQLPAQLFHLLLQDFHLLLFTFCVVHQQMDVPRNRAHDQSFPAAIKRTFRPDRVVPLLPVTINHLEV